MPNRCGRRRSGSHGSRTPRRYELRPLECKVPLTARPRDGFLARVRPRDACASLGCSRRLQAQRQTCGLTPRRTVRVDRRGLDRLATRRGTRLFLRHWTDLHSEAAEFRLADAIRACYATGCSVPVVGGRPSFRGRQDPPLRPALIGANRETGSQAFVVRITAGSPPPASRPHSDATCHRWGGRADETLPEGPARRTGRRRCLSIPPPARSPAPRRVARGHHCHPRT